VPAGDIASGPFEFAEREGAEHVSSWCEALGEGLFGALRDGAAVAVEEQVAEHVEGDVRRRRPAVESGSDVVGKPAPGFGLSGESGPVVALAPSGQRMP
jgi:hypothetical protein